MELEDKMIVEAWLAIGQDPLKGAEQKGGAFWHRIHDYFHEHRRYGENRLDNDSNECSIQKWWGTIQAECNKLQAAYDHVKRVPVSGIGVMDLVWQALDYFKMVNEGRTFVFPHCWKDLRGIPKFNEGYEVYMASLIGSKTAKHTTH